MNKKISTLVTLPMLAAASLSAQTLITGDSNSVDITELTYERNGSTIVQSLSASSVTNTDDPVYLRNAKINDGGTIKDLQFFNIGGTIQNVNFSSNATGVGVINNGAITSIAADGLANYTVALEGILNDTNINNYAFYDGVGNIPPAGTSDFDIQFANPFRAGTSQSQSVMATRFSTSPPWIKTET